MPLLGNDVVDLAASEDKSGDGRFLARVLTASEGEYLAASPMPKKTLWLFWAAKEAAYKAIKAATPSVCSIPRRYEVDLKWPPRLFLRGEGSPLSPAGRVITPAGQLELLAVMNRNYIHAIAIEPGVEAAGLVQRVARMDEGGKAGDPSAFVRRLLLKDVSRRLSCPERELAVAKEPESGAPLLLRVGKPLPAAGSLSHDGFFVAYAFLFL